jgi:GxxExxY protein
VAYQRALAFELEAAKIDFAREENIPIFYEDVHIDTRRVDFVIGDCIVELKARSHLLPEDYVQALSYLRASRFRLGLLINFGAEKVEVKRYVNDRGKYNPVE